MKNEPTIRRLDVADLADCVALGVSRDWDPDEVKWRLLLEVGTGFGIDDPEHGLIGTVTACRYGHAGGSEVVSIGMMLVAHSHQRQGLGRRLMEHTLDWCGDATVMLTATPLGRPLYEKLGFAVAGRVAGCFGEYLPEVGGPAATGLVRDAGPGDLASVIRRDAAVFGADRGDLLRYLAGIADRVVVTDDLSGYAFGWRNSGVRHIGPLAAADEIGARALIDALAREESGRVRVDLPQRFTALAQWMSGRGIKQEFTVPLMIHGGGALPGDHAIPYTLALQALG